MAVIFTVQVSSDEPDRDIDKAPGRHYTRPYHGACMASSKGNVGAMDSTSTSFDARGRSQLRSRDSCSKIAFKFNLVVVSSFRSLLNDVTLL